MQKTDIQYADYVSNPFRAWDPETGKDGWACAKVQPGCANCWAETINKRFGTHLQYSDANLNKLEFFFDEDERKKISSARPRLHKHHDIYPYIFVCDMTDWLLPQYDQWRDYLLYDLSSRIDIRFLLLTKRWDRLPILLKSKVMPSPNIFIGLTLTHEDENTEKALRNLMVLNQYCWPIWISHEPAIGPLHLPGWMDDLSFLVFGGETGPYARPAKEDWARYDLAWCASNHVPFFFKQWGHHLPDNQEPGALDGHIWHAMPGTGFPVHDIENASAFTGF